MARGLCGDRPGAWVGASGSEGWDGGGGEARAGRCGGHRDALSAPRTVAKEVAGTGATPRPAGLSVRGPSRRRYRRDRGSTSLRAPGRVAGVVARAEAPPSQAPRGVRGHPPPHHLGEAERPPGAL